MNGNSVLIVDTRDAVYIRDLQKTFNVEIAESVSSAVEKIERSSFDAAITNIDLVGLNLLPTIKKLCPDTVLIAVSSEGSINRLIEVMRMGFYDYVFHPFPSDYLANSINSGVRVLLIEREKARDLETMAGERGSVSAVLQSMSDGLIVTDRNQNVVFCNVRAAELLGKNKAVFGLSLSELIGQPVEVDSEQTELELITPDGSAQLLMRTRLILDAERSLLDYPVSGIRRSAPRSGEILGWVSVLTDVTEISKSNQSMADATRRCIHDINAPLGAVRKNLEVLLDGFFGSLNDKQRFTLARMVKRIDALLELEKDLLNLSSIESGSSPLELELLSLTDPVREVADLMRSKAAEKGIRMRLPAEPDPLVVRVDRGAMRRILTNLISNAIKYTLSGGIVQIRVGQNDGKAFIEVMDTGIGISAENRQHIFEKFYRVRGRQTAAIVGTGLGLPIVKALVEDLNGEIKVDSEVGRGSTFTVFLPIAEATVVRERESKVLDSEKYVLLSDLDTNFKNEISHESGGENIKHCFSCGTCVAACPVRWINDKYNPRKIIRMALLGMRKQVLESDFIWFCSTCYTCHERCPQEVQITQIMNVLKNIASREGYAHPAYIRQADTIRSLGRLYEIDQFDNRKRERLGLPSISTDAGEMSQIYEITGMDKIIGVGKS